MTIALTLNLPPDLYDTLTELANNASVTPEQWAIASLRRQLSHPVRDPNLRKLFGSVNLGAPLGLDNQSIDTALAQEYAAN